MLSYTIIICTFNNSLSLSETLQSICALNLPQNANVECCLIDNNSSDNTRSVCETFITHSKIPTRYFFEQKQGLSAARNRGVQEAIGDVLLFTDDDVIVDPMWLNNYIARFNNDAPDVVYGKILPEWRGQKPKWFIPELNAAYALLDYGDQVIEVKQRRFEFYGANFGLKKSVLLDYGGFDPKLGRTGSNLFIGEELQLFIKMLEAGLKIIYDPTIIVNHVIAEKRKTKRFLKKYYSDIAQSLVYLGDRNPNRQFLGVPYFRMREFFVFYTLIPVQLLYLIFTGQFSKIFVLHLRTICMNAMVCLYVSKYFTLLDQRL